MSTTPEPLSEERLAQAERFANVAKETGLSQFQCPVCAGSGEYGLADGDVTCPRCMGSGMVRGYIAHHELVEKDVPALLAEARRLRGSWCGGHDTKPKCGDCAGCLREKLKAAQDLLLERARQAEELLRERDALRLLSDDRSAIIDRLIAERDEALAQLAKNEGRVKEIVDEKLLRERDGALLQLNDFREAAKCALMMLQEAEGIVGISETRQGHMRDRLWRLINQSTETRKYDPLCECGHDPDQHTKSGPMTDKCAASDSLGRATCFCDGYRVAQKRNDPFRQPKGKDILGSLPDLPDAPDLLKTHPLTCGNCRAEIRTDLCPTCVAARDREFSS